MVSKKFTTGQQCHNINEKLSEDMLNVLDNTVDLTMKDIFEKARNF